MATTAVTSVGVRDGDPDALAGLCDRRGPAVLAYCEVVAGRGQIAPAAEAFGSFRSAVVAAPALGDLNPEALLISATRHAAARYAGLDAPPPCARVPALLAARADRSISLADHDWLGEHLASCWTCRAPVARFEAADRVYLDPPDDALEPEVTAAIIAALTAAAPLAGRHQASSAHEAMPSTNGSAPHAPPAEDPQAIEPPFEGYVDQPTAAYQLGVDDLDLVDTRAEVPAPAPERAGRRAALLGALRRSPREPRQTRRARAERADEPRIAGGGTPLPRPLRAAAAGSGRGRPSLRRGLVLPLGLVILAIVLALLLAGVFGGGEPAPQGAVPGPDAPANTGSAPAIVVPGTDDEAGAEAVERAKSRIRAAKRRAAQQRETSATNADASPTATPTDTDTGTPTTPSASAPAADEAPAAAPAKKPGLPQRDESSAGKTKIDADNGATGVEQLPPSQDTSTVPDLAPPAGPSVPPAG